MQTVEKGLDQKYFFISAKNSFENIFSKFWFSKFSSEKSKISKISKIRNFGNFRFFEIFRFFDYFKKVFPKTISPIELNSGELNTIAKVNVSLQFRYWEKLPL